MRVCVVVELLDGVVLGEGVALIVPIVFVAEGEGVFDGVIVAVALIDDVALDELVGDVVGVGVDVGLGGSGTPAIPRHSLPGSTLAMDLPPLLYAELPIVRDHTLVRLETNTSVRSVLTAT